MSANNGEMWEEYHRRLREVRTTWDVDPLDRIIEAIEKMPPWLPIGDFGCGEAFLADKFGLSTITTDHKPLNRFDDEFITEDNIETIKTKIENEEAITTEDFDEVFDSNVSPN